MKHAAIAVLLLCAAVPLLAQEAAPVAAESGAWQAPRPSWGDPDLRGNWPLDYLGQTPRERPAQYGSHATLSDADYDAALARAREQLDWYGREEQAGMMAMGHWIERGLPLRQNSLIVEPANGR